jgi:hypothetical protein
MRQVIRALGWAINIFWIILLLFSVTGIYSASQIMPGFGQPSMSTSDDTLTLTLPFYIINGGFYDISSMNLTTVVEDAHGSLISDSSTFVGLIPHGNNISVTHNISINISKLTSTNLAYLLFDDSIFDADASLKLNYVAVPFQISINFTIPWGAPLSALTIGNVSASPYNATHFRTSVPTSFENHSFLRLDGTIRLELVDGMNNILGSGISNINVPPQSGYNFSLDAFVSNPTNIKQAHLYFATSLFNYGPVVIPIV